MNELSKWLSESAMEVMKNSIKIFYDNKTNQNSILKINIEPLQVQDLLRLGAD